MASPRRRDALLSAWTCAWVSPEAEDPLLPRPRRCPSGASSLARGHEWFHVKRGCGKPQGRRQPRGCRHPWSIDIHGASVPRECRRLRGCRNRWVSKPRVSEPREYRQIQAVFSLHAAARGHRNGPRPSKPLQPLDSSATPAHRRRRARRGLLRRPSPQSRLGRATLPGSAFPAARPLYAGPVA